MTKIILNTEPLIDHIRKMPVDKLGLLAEILNDAVGEARFYEVICLEKSEEGDAFYFSERARVARELRDLIVKMNANFLYLIEPQKKELLHA